jgi:hypothetical protein
VLRLLQEPLPETPELCSTLSIELQRAALQGDPFFPALYSMRDFPLTFLVSWAVAELFGAEHPLVDVLSLRVSHATFAVSLLKNASDEAGKRGV